MTSIEAAFHESLEHAHRKLDALVLVIHHLLTRDISVMDHAAVLDLAKAADKSIDDKVDAALSAFSSYKATHEATKESLDDIGDILSAMPAKLAKLDGITAPASADPAPAPSAPSTVTVSAPTPAGSTTIPVIQTDTPVTIGSAVSGDAVAPGTTVADSDVSSVTLSQPTVSDHDVGDTIEVGPAV